MTKAVEKLYEAQEIDHRRLTRLDGQTSLLAKMTKTAFQHNNNNNNNNLFFHSSRRYSSCT